MDAHQQPTPIYVLWKEENTANRERILDLLPREDLASLRLASSACCNITTKRLFKRITVTFTPNTFTKNPRVQALSRIGHHVEHLTFHFAHSLATFLPPLIHPHTGAEISFLYTPHTSMASVMARPKYANMELGEILTQQYPPLFHAATNVPSFIHALRNLTELRHLTIRTPGQDPRERYRRDAVDYALVSLRIALERAPLRHLDTLSLSHMHPSALHYLRHSPGGCAFGALPSSPRRWRQIRKLSLAVESWDFDDPASPGRDHLLIVDDYLRALAPQLEKLSFSWLGRRGPCPLALHADPLFAPPRGARKLFNEVTSPMSPLPAVPGRQALHFPCLRRLAVCNAVVNAPQVSGLVGAHRDTVRQLDFEDVVLAGGGSWEDALAPLTGQTTSSGNGKWSQRSRSGSASDSGYGSMSETGSHSLHSVPSRDDLPSTPSAAVAAASRDLFDYEFAGAELSQQSQQQQPSPRLFGEVGEELLEEIFASGPHDVHHGSHREEQQEKGDDEGQGRKCDDLEVDLASEIAAAREQSMTYTTKLRKKRRRKHSGVERGEQKETHHSSDEKRSQSRSRSRSRSQSHSRHRKHKHHRHRHDQADQKSQTLHKQPSAASVSRSESAATMASGSSRRHRPSSPPPPPPPPTHIPDVPPLPDNLSNITAPIMDVGAPPVLLQPTVYDPSRSKSSRGSVSGSGSGSADLDKGISSVQRNIEQDETRRVMAEDPAARTSALRKAKAAVLNKLSEQFVKKQAASGSESGAAGGGLAMTGTGAAEACAIVMGARLREGLFGKSCVSVLPDERGMSSQSALVPLMFTRS